MRIGVTFFLRDDTSIWSNGATQHCVFLWQLLRAAGHDVFAINGGDATAPSPKLMTHAVPGLSFVSFDEVAAQLDLLIEMGAQVSAEQVERVHSQGGKAVSFKVGNAFVIDTERIIHGKQAGAIFNGSKFDEIWTNPQHVPSCAAFGRPATAAQCASCRTSGTPRSSMPRSKSSQRTCRSGIELDRGQSASGSSSQTRTS